jgi:peptide subunit release factor 1 (eRF1)
VELKIASNIKSKQVSKAVISALKMLQSQLKLYKETPVNGMVLFSGEFSLESNATNHKSFV